MFFACFLWARMASANTDTVTVYYDAAWEKTDKESAEFYRKAYKNEKELWVVKDYFLKTNVLQMEGVYSDKKFKNKNGIFTYFFDNGEKKSKVNFNDDKKDGIWESWYLNQTLYSRGLYKNGAMEGEWNWYFENGQKSSSEQYLNDSLLSFVFWDNHGNVSSTKGITKIETMPKFKGGDDELFAYLKENLKYPTIAKENGIAGTVYLKFVVGEKGSVEDVTIVRSPNELLSSEAKRLIQEMPKWTPGYQHNLPVRVYYNIPIKFTLKRKL